jgi:hypothetical protein
VEVTTLTNYPFSVVLDGVTTLSGPAPTSFGEIVSKRSCPNGATTKCYQYFGLNWPYSICQWGGAQYTLTFSYTAPGLSNVPSTITLNSENWCSEFGVNGPALPAITSISPTTAVRGQPFTLNVYGTALDGGGNGTVIINFANNVLSPSSVSATHLTYSIPGSLTSGAASPVAITVQTGGGVSNQVLLTLQ